MAVEYEELPGSPMFEFCSAGRIFRTRRLLLSPHPHELLLTETVEIETGMQTVGINGRPRVTLGIAEMDKFYDWCSSEDPNIRRDEAGIDFVLRRLDKSAPSSGS